MFWGCLGLCFVEIVVCVVIGFGCDRMSLNSLYWDVDAPIAHPFCDHCSIGRKSCDRRESLAYAAVKF